MSSAPISFHFNQIIPNQPSKLHSSSMALVKAFHLFTPQSAPLILQLLVASPVVSNTGRGHGHGHHPQNSCAVLHVNGSPSLHPCSHQCWRRQWHPTPVLLPGKSHGRRSLVGCSPWCRYESDTTEHLHFHFSLSRIGEGMATHSRALA